MARKAPKLSSDDADKVKRDPRRLFATRRTRLWFTLFVIFFAVNAAELGLVSQQIHERGTVVDVNTTWPGAEVEHVFGLLLFACLVSLLFAIFHWAFNLAIYVVVFFVLSTFWGVGAGVIERTPFGHGLQCHDRNNVFPPAYEAIRDQCTRWTAVEALAWTMFGLSIIGFVAALVDRFEIRAVKNQVYDLEVHDEEKAAINRAPSAVSADAASHH